MNAVEYEIMASVEDAHWWWRARREIVAAVIRRYAPAAGDRPRRLVEVGCGTGGNLAMLAEFGDVVAAESSDVALGLLRRRLEGRFEIVRHRIPEDLPGAFDVICCLDVLEHVKDDAEAMRWLAGRLSPGGLAIVTVPAFDVLWSPQDEAVRHYRRYTSRGLARLVPPGIEQVHLTYFNTILFLPMLAARAVMRWLHRSGSAPSSHLGLPPRPINALLYRLFRLERHLVPRRRLPVGVSLLLVVRRSR